MSAEERAREEEVREASTPADGSARAAERSARAALGRANGVLSAGGGLFLEAMWKFDQHVASGRANQGDIQNGKGDFFNDFLSGLLKACSDKDVHTRPGVPGLSFRNHKLDIAYPATGRVELIVETKATGVPKHGRNPQQRNPEGRPGSADLEKRIKEAAFKNIDIKGEAARDEGRGGGATSDLASWLRATSPKCYLFLAVRVVDNRDLARAIDLGHTATVWFEGCGLYCYGKTLAGDAYEPKTVHTTLELDRVLSNVCTALRSLS